jgi:hypothetical protein
LRLEKQLCKIHKSATWVCICTHTLCTALRSEQSLI